MHLPRPTFSAALLATTILVPWALAARRAESAPRHPAAPSVAHSQVDRIRLHFDRVLGELDARDVSTLTPLQGARRVALLATLRAYRDAGLFPHNYDFPNRAVPYFVDRKTGTLCAVAHLMASTGRRDIVDRVARLNNNVWVSQLAGDTAFMHWLDVNGLTLAEAERIQVVYVVATPTPVQAAQNVAAFLIPSVAIGAATITSGLNAFGNGDSASHGRIVAGFATGGAALGASALVATVQHKRSLAAYTAAMGAMSIGLSTRSLHRHNVLVAEQAAQQKKGLETSFAPIVPLGHGAGAGVELSIRF